MRALKRAVFAVVIALHHLAHGMKPGHGPPNRDVAHSTQTNSRAGPKDRAQGGQQFWMPRRHRGDANGLWKSLSIIVDEFIAAEAIHLVKPHARRFSGGADFFQDGIDRQNLLNRLADGLRPLRGEHSAAQLFEGGF